EPVQVWSQRNDQRAFRLGIQGVRRCPRRQQAGMNFRILVQQFSEEPAIHANQVVTCRQIGKIEVEVKETGHGIQTILCSRFRKVARSSSASGASAVSWARWAPAMAHFSS